MPSHRSRTLLIAGVLAGGLFVACGSDDGTTTVSTTSAPADAPGSPVVDSTPDTTADTSATSAPPATASTTTGASTTGPSTTEAGSSDPSGDVAPVCAAFESIFIAGLISSFAAFDDPDVVEPLLLGFMPALAERFEAAVAALPAEGVSAEFEEATRAASTVFSEAAAAVRAAGVTDAELEGLGAVLDPDVLEAGPSGGDLGDLIDDDVLDRLAAVEFDVDAELADAPEPDEAQLVTLCPSLGDYLGVGGPALEDACAIVDELALAVVFTEPHPTFDPDDVDTGMCAWEDDATDRELVVSVTDRTTIEQTRTGNESSMEVVVIEGLGDDAFSIDGLLAGVSSTGGRGGLGSGRATVGVTDGDRGLLVAVRADDGDPVALATDVATILLGG